MSEMFEKEYYFKLDAEYDKHKDGLSDKYHLYFGGLVNTAFYKPHKSTPYLKELMNKHGDSLSEIEKKNVNKALYMNYYNLNIYKEALKHCTILIDNHQMQMDSAAYNNLLNDKKILDALKNTPPQDVQKKADSWVNLFKDKMGLVNIGLTLGSDSLDFLFDTGSSFSFIKQSIAKNAGMDIHDIDFPVEGATGAEVICDIAVADSLHIGNVTIRNAVFWVFDDKDLTLPEYDYSVNGAIAFPIIKAMEEIHLYRDTSVFIPFEPKYYAINNLAIDDLDPVICVQQASDTLPFYFDTGAAFTSFYKPYYMRDSIHIDTTYEKKSFNIGSIGGVKEFYCYIIDSMQLGVAGEYAYVHDIETHTEPIYKDAEKVFGNLGQDFSFQFEKMVISTREAAVLFE